MKISFKQMAKWIYALVVIEAFRFGIWQDAAPAAKMISTINDFTTCRF